MHADAVSFVGRADRIDCLNEKGKSSGTTRLVVRITTKAPFSLPLMLQLL